MCYPGRVSREIKQKQQKGRKGERETLATCAGNEVLEWPSECSHESRLLPPARVVQRGVWFRISVFNVDTVLANRKRSATLFPWS